ncbi:uncharacterized protein PGTG_03899 [Puccinia graminis f. sp. tritici CRL 75-36-700-3]|uniref:Uncharacterized protein n=1 Tax=Puccinia graminis f. sp. tritici (strain CRL 75-36-700-3 / race SCCL) TaxID=418459 RepID=E3K0W8_PUCGT|nr:uncharacterized protein PGTG_03899 [Puccinia graminis f. sp. tritici CRL 75-36-700-3]EFP77943.2 hypothetical protein PGTG_03899 [Puccinia graminis f. sp. tritici CRL 75-36-700-3]
MARVRRFTCSSKPRSLSDGPGRGGTGNLLALTAPHTRPHTRIRAIDEPVGYRCSEIAHSNQACPENDVVIYRYGNKSKWIHSGITSLHVYCHFGTQIP